MFFYIFWLFKYKILQYLATQIAFRLLAGSLASETLSGVTQSRFRLYSFIYWLASVASETLTGVKMKKIGDVCLFVYMYGRT